MKKKRWRGVLTLQGVESGDHRVLDRVTWRELPLTLRLQTEDFGGHDGATPVGSIESLQVMQDGQVWGDGPFSESESGELAALWVAERTVRGVSVDPGAISYTSELVDPATGAVVPMTKVHETWEAIDAATDSENTARADELYAWLESLYERIRFDPYEIAAATLVATPAFPQASIEVYEVDDETGAEVDDDEPSSNGSELAPLAPRLAALLDSKRARFADVGRMTLQQPPEPAETLAPAPRLRQASAPATMRAEWFAPLDEPPRKFTITDEGRMLGYLFTWDSCHRSFLGRCETPDYQADFSEFHTGEVALDDGNRMRVGVLTCAAEHAPDGAFTEQQLARLMEDTGLQLGPVRLYSDSIGVQACGQVFDDVDETTVARALAGYPSGDWRMVRGQWRLFGLHTVNTPGHPSYEEVDGQPLRIVASVGRPGALSAACGCSTHETSPEPAESDTEASSVQSCRCSSSLSRAGRLQLLDLDVALLNR